MDDMSEPVSEAAERVAAHAAREGVPVDVVRFPEGTRTAADAAAAIGCDVAQIVKSIVVTSEGGPILVLTSGRNQVSYRKVGQALRAAGVRRADAEEAKAATGYAIGGTPPFAHGTDLPVLCDEDLLDFDKVWAAAGTPDAVFSIEPRALVRVAGARVVDVAETESA